MLVDHDLIRDTLAPLIEPNPTSVEEPGSGVRFVVIVYDNDFNTMNEVMSILIAATGCSEDEAFIETWEVHYLGHSVVHHGDLEECEPVAEIIRMIGIYVEVVEE